MWDGANLIRFGGFSMLCPKCGRTVPDGVPCPCGAPLLSSNPAVNVIKTLGSSPLFLAAAILYTASVVLGFFSSLGSSALFTELYYYGANYGLDPDIFYPLMDALESGSVVTVVVEAIPSLLMAAAMWMFYATCCSTKSGNISTAGLTVCKVLSYITVVGICLLALLLVACFVILLIAAAAGGVTTASYYDGYGYDYGYGAAASATAVIVLVAVVLVVAVALLVLLLVYQLAVIRTINRVKASALTGTPDNRVPRFLTGMLFVLGVLGGLGGLASLFTSPVSGLAALASAACMILLALCLGRYRNLMTMLLFPPVQPVYPGGPVPPYQGTPPQQPGGPYNGGTPQ